jgi:processive 1,2-diacylglycerol beta-glucosyltransferase
MRILIATVTAGGGHLQAALALEEAWKALRPDDAVERVDLLDFVSRLHRKVYADGYVKLTEHAPELYALAFKKTDNPDRNRKLSDFRRRFTRHVHRGFIRHLKGFEPDAVVCTHFLPLEVLEALKSKGEDGHPFTVCVVTDFEAHAFWIAPSVGLYCVAAEETRASLSARGASAGQVAVTGIPIAARFSEPIDRQAVRLRHGFRTDLPVVLVLSGGFGVGPVAEVLAELDKVGAPFQTVVVTGRNAELRRTLAGQDRHHPTDVLGFVSNMHELMAVSDLILTKPGGLTSSEALAMGKPLFILNPIPGQEAANSDFLLERGAAVKVNRVQDLPYRLERLLGSPKLKDMSRAAKALGRPGAARDICAETVKRAEVQ